MHRNPLYRHSSFLVALLSICFGIAACQPTQDRDSAEESDGQELTVVTYGGGAYQQSHIDAFIEPFEATAGSRAVSVPWGAEYGRLLEMVRSGSVPWDVVEVTAAQFARGREDDIFQPLLVTIPPEVFTPIQGAPHPSSLGVPNVYWSTVLAYHRESFGDRSPRTWSDFWNTSAFPGARALYDNPRGNLEFALLADGVELDELYPLDVDRAFSKLDEIKPHVRLWWNDGTESVNALMTGRVAMSSAWSGRIFASTQAQEELAYVWNGAAHELDYWIIPKGAPNPQLASDFILFASRPSTMAAQATATAYGPANALAVREIPSSVLPHLPTAPDNWTVSFVINSEWWMENEEELTQRWIVWKSQ